MNPDQFFLFANSLAFFTWILILFAPRWKWTSRIIVNVSVLILALFYAYFVTRSLSFGDFESFSTLDGIHALFNNRIAVLAGWLHYLAFDLMVGWFILLDSKRNNINRFLIIPALLLTFFMGPLGFLTYLLLRTLSKKTFFVDFEN